MPREHYLQFCLVIFQFYHRVRRCNYEKGNFSVINSVIQDILKTLT